MTPSPALRRGIQLDINRAEGFYNLGLVYRRKGQPEMAVQAYREATRINPRMADAHFNIANIFLEKMQYGLAIAHYRQALEIRPTWEKALRGLEQAEVSQKEIQGKKLQETLKVPEPEAKAPPKSAMGTTLPPDRLVDPMLHGELLRTLNKVTIDSENQGRNFLKALEAEVEPVIKELSSCLLYPDHPSAELNECVRKFETAMQNMRNLNDMLQTSMERVRLIGDQMLKT